MKIDEKHHPTKCLDYCVHSDNYGFYFQFPIIQKCLIIIIKICIAGFYGMLYLPRPSLFFAAHQQKQNKALKE